MSHNEQSHFQFVSYTSAYFVLHRTGFTVHEAGFSASSRPIWMEWNKSNETCTMVFIRAIRSMFAANTGDSIPYIPNAILGSDRGYLIKLLLTYALETYAHVVGTLQRASWLPYTFGKEDPKATEESISIKPRNIKGKGAKAGGISTHKWKLSNGSTRSIACGFYRSGSSTGSVALEYPEQKSHADCVVSTVVITAPSMSGVLLTLNKGAPWNGV